MLLQEQLSHGGIESKLLKADRAALSCEVRYCSQVVFDRARSRIMKENRSTDYINHYSSLLGNIILASDGEALTGLWFAGQKYEGSTLAAEHRKKDLPVFDETRRWLDDYFTGKDPGFTPPLRLRGTDFRKTVWEVLLTIPYGKTTTYGEIAAQIARETGHSVSARAVGGAVGHNPVSLIVPCHRVVGADGSLTGYAGGVERKAKLLEMERSTSKS